MDDKLNHIKNNAIALLLDAKNSQDIDDVCIEIFGKNGQFSEILAEFKTLSVNDKPRVGKLINEFKNTIESEIKSAREKTGNANKISQEFFDVTLPGIKPQIGHQHLVTQAISEISRIFERIGFSRVRHPEVDWDYYAFEALNMPEDHPARDEWETFFINKSKMSDDRSKISKHQSKLGSMVLTPHTSNGQVREMEKRKLPIRMINIAKCYRRQNDISHTEMFHQFEGLYVDKNVSISHLKGVIEYFVKQYYGPDRMIRLRPFHFQFTEPSFEIDISCALCKGTGQVKKNEKCRLCKAGWLELGGAGMVHPNVLKTGKIDVEVYNGFAFGWGVERTFMMKSEIQIDDIRLIYGNDIRFLEQF